jgi:HSP20 family protein
MTLIKRNNYRSGFPVFFDDFFNRDFFNPGSLNFSNTYTTIPAVNIRENNEGFMIEVAAPGMSKKDFNIKLDENLLTISSEKSEEKEDKADDKFTRREFSYQSFSRSFNLKNDLVDMDKIEARYEDGILLVSIPKKESEKQKPKRMIEVA